MIPQLILFAFFLIFRQGAFAVGEEETVLDLKDQNTVVNWKRNPQTELQERNPTKQSRPSFPRKGNLQSNLVRIRGLGTTQGKDPIRYPELGPINKSGIEVGDILDCIIRQDVKAYVGSISPIRAEVISGPFMGLVFIGNATMDPKTKDIVVEFDKLRNEEKNVKHTVKATLHSSTGEFGLKGTFHSKYWQYFFATVIARSAEGYASATVQRDRNVFGMYQDQPSVENAGKKAVVEAASSTAGIVADQMRNLPEFVTKKGPIRTKIFITETPKLLN